MVQLGVLSVWTDGGGFRGPVPGLIRVEDRDGRLAITTVTSKGITARSRTASASTRALSSARIVASPTAYLPATVPHIAGTTLQRMCARSIAMQSYGACHALE